MNAYLSIDLDFWCDETTPHSATRFFRRLLSRFGRPIMVALHHHHLVDHINGVKGLDTVINLDAHSDLTDELGDTLTLGEGNWANFINFQSFRFKRGTYVWRYPDEGRLDQDTGYCHRMDNPFEECCTSWAHVKKKKGLARIPWDSIREVGVSLSPGWLADNPGVVAYPIKILGLYEWAGKWWALNNLKACNGLPDSAFTDMENGVGIFRPHLIRPKRGV